MGEKEERGGKGRVGAGEWSGRGMRLRGGVSIAAAVNLAVAGAERVAGVGPCRTGKIACRSWPGRQIVSGL